MNRNIIFDSVIKDGILEDLRHCNSYWVWLALPSIAVDLTHKFPIESVATWINGGITPNVTLVKLDDRSTMNLFLKRLTEMDLEDAGVRIPNGSQDLNVGNVVDELASLSSFDSAINTWMVICREWLAICNVDYIFETLGKVNNPKPDASVARVLVGALQMSLY